MASGSSRGRRDGALDAVRGRTDAGVDLRRHLASAPPSYVTASLENPGMGEDELLVLLRNRSAPPGVLVRILQDRRWVRSYAVKKGLLRHPRMPLTLARSLLPHLYWKDLADVVEDPRIAPSVRRQAEEVLKKRIDDLTVGERVSLARRASRGVIGALRESAEARVLRALLGNVRLMEHDALRIASGPRAPRDVLAGLADHPAWGARYSVRLCLVKNPRTPVPVALRLVAGLPLGDLERIASDGRVPRIVRVGADRRLGADGARPGRDGHG